MRILLATVSAPHYMAPPILSDEQVNCGPFFSDRVIDGRVISLATPKGEYDLAAIAARLPAEQQPEAVVCLVDSSWFSIPKNLAAFKCPKIALIADTHHMTKPILGMIGYLTAQKFDRHIMLYTRHHLELFRAAGIRNLSWLPGLTFPHRDGVVRGVRRDERSAGVVLIGQSSNLYQRRLALAGALAGAGLPLNFREGTQRESLEFYGSSLIGLNATANADLNLRALEITAAGSLMLMDRLAPQSGVGALWQDGREYVSYGNAGELVEQARHYLAHPAEARGIGEAAARWFDQHLNFNRRRQLLEQLVLDGREDPMFALPAPAKSVGSPFKGNTARYVAALAVYEHVQKLHSTAEMVRVLVDDTVPGDFARICATLPRVQVASSFAEGESPDYFVTAATRALKLSSLPAPRLWCWDATPAQVPQLAAQVGGAGLVALREGVAFFGLPAADAGPVFDKLAAEARHRLHHCDAGGALDFARQALEVNPRSIDACLVIAEVALGGGKPELCTKMIAKAREIAPGDSRIALLELAARQVDSRQRPAERMLSTVMRHMADADLPAARALALRATKIDPQLATASFWLGQITFRLADKQAESERNLTRSAGLEALSRAAELAPQRADFAYELGLALWQVGRLSDSAGALERSVTADPHDPATWSALGRVLLAAGEGGRASAAFERALGHHPTDRLLLQGLERAQQAGAKVTPVAPTAAPVRETGEKLRILFISSEFPPETGFGGIGTYVAHLAPALAARGHQVTVLSRSLGSTDTEATVNGVRIVRLYTRSAPLDLWQEPFDRKQVVQAKEYYDRAYTVALALESNKSLAADIIEAPDWAGEAALVRAVCPDVPYVVKFHTPAKLVFAWNGAGVSGGFVEALHALERIAVRNALGFTSPSRWLIPEVEKLFALPQGVVKAIPNPFVPGAVPARQPGRTVLYVGRLEARKGVIEAVAPMVRVMRSLPDVHWRLAGADTASGPDGASMKQTLLSRIPPDLHSRVDILGSLGREQLAEELTTAGAVLLPSRKENFPYACLEAMAAGAPVIGSRNGGMSEMIATGRTGLLVDPTQPDAVFDATLRLLEQPLFAESLSGAAQASVAECFRPEVIAPQVEKHYRQVIALAQSSS